MNRTEIAYQVSLTLGDHIESFDMEGILDDLDEAGVTTSVDDIEDSVYWMIVERHDTGARAQEEAVQAHADFLQAEAEYKEATVRRQVSFAKAIDATGRGGNAILSHAVELAAPTVKSIADRGRDVLASPKGADVVSAVRTAASLAAEHRDYGYDLDHGGRELHRLHPELSGLYQARMLLWKAAAEKWEEGHPDAVFGSLDMPVDEAPVGHDLLVEEYERRVNAIAEGRPLPLEY
jgi:hypothetical protein